MRTSCKKPAYPSQWRYKLAMRNCGNPDVTETLQFNATQIAFGLQGCEVIELEETQVEVVKPKSLEQEFRNALLETVEGLGVN